MRLSTAARRLWYCKARRGVGSGDELVEQECDFWGSLVLPGVFGDVRLVGVWVLATNLWSKNVIFGAL